MRTVKEALSQRVLLADGSVTRLLGSAKVDAKRDFFGADGVFPVLNVTRASLVKEVHQAYLLAGADVIRTNSLEANPLSLKQHGLQDEAFIFNYKAAENAVNAVDSVPGQGRRRFVLGVIRDDGWNATPAEVEQAVDIQAQGLLSGGADALILDCLPGIGRIQPVLTGARRARAALNSDAPIFLQQGAKGTDFSEHVRKQTDGVLRYRPGDADRKDTLQRWLEEGSVNLVGGGDTPGATARLDEVLRALAEDGLRPLQDWVRTAQPVDDFEPASSWTHFPEAGEDDTLEEAEQLLEAAK